MTAANNDEALFGWQSPDELWARVVSLRSQLGAMALKRPGKNFREAYVASQFASWRSASAVRLIEPTANQPTPDFAIMLGSQEYWFETTEADRRGRKRGNEVLDPASIVEPIPKEHWVGPRDYHALVRERVRSKMRKSYVKCDGLVVWSNAFPIIDEEELTFDWWRSTVVDARTKFAEIWVHHGEKFIQLH